MQSIFCALDVQNWNAIQHWLGNSMNTASCPGDLAYFAIGYEIIYVTGFEDTASISHQYSQLGTDCISLLLPYRTQLHPIHHCPNLQKYFPKSLYDIIGHITFSKVM